MLKLASLHFFVYFRYDKDMSDSNVRETKITENTDGDPVVRIVYFSSATNNTQRFADKLGFPAERIPLLPRDGFLTVDYDYVLIVPTYGGGTEGGAVPKQVIKFLNDESNRSLCRGVIASGNTNFGEGYCLAGSIISRKVKVPLLYKFELLGNREDVVKVQEGLKTFWKTLK